MSRSTGRSRATTHRLARAVSAATPDIHPSHALPRLARMIEVLEPRRLLASDTIDGTGGDDTITIDAGTTVGVTGDPCTVHPATVNGTTSTLGPTNPAGNSLTVNCLGGNDNVTVPHEGFGDLLNV